MKPYGNNYNRELKCIKKYHRSLLSSIDYFEFDKNAGSKKRSRREMKEEIREQINELEDNDE